MLKTKIFQITLQFIGNLQNRSTQKIDAAKPQAPLEKQNACTVTPRKAKLAQHAPEAPATPKVEAVHMTKQPKFYVEAAPVAKQASPAKQEEPEPGPTLALPPPFALKVDKATKVKFKP